jgi:peptidoglycan/LPS O-acetylase OafA/YrhL
MHRPHGRRTKTLGGALEETGGFGAGFDFLRVALAFGVLLWHERLIVGGADAPLSAPDQLIGISILPMFFGLSGFLITGSALRLSLPNFLINRGLRIFPALFVEIMLSAFILGPIFTRLPLSDYFRARGTYHYLTNIVGKVNYDLPGVFSHNHWPAVNWSLWTIPYELLCYGLMSALIVTRLLRRPLLSLALPFLWLAFVWWAPLGDMLTAILTRGIWGRPGGEGLCVSFLLGIAFYLNRDRVPYSGFMALAALGAIVLCAVLPRIPSQVMQVPLVYLAVFIGVSRITPLPVFRRGDYSYGIYLYAMPIQQAVRAALPTTGAALHLALSAALVTLFAIFSWHCVEKPVLRLRRRFSFVARVRGVEADRPPDPTIAIANNSQQH